MDYDNWIPVSEEQFPTTDEYILISFANFTIPMVGRFEWDQDGNGAFYVGYDVETCASQDLIVNAWMPLPHPWRED